MSKIIPPTREDLLRAAETLRGVANRTPVYRSRTLNQLLGGEVHLKGEHQQRGGAFKFRGAYNTLSGLSAEARARGVVTWSSGNHAGGLALAGKLLGIQVTVVMPRNAKAIKRAAALEYGAQIVPSTPEEREEVGWRLAEEKGLTPIPPYDHNPIIAGQGTAALELLEEHESLDLILAPVGGGGLLAGTALAASGREKVPKVYGVEPEVADDAARSMALGRIVTLKKAPDTIADGLRTRFLGERNFEIIRRHVSEIITVSEQEIIQALSWLWIRMKLPVEPSGAVALAALLSRKIELNGRRAGVILSGGNADPSEVADLLKRGVSEVQD